MKKLLLIGSEGMLGSALLHVLSRSNDVSTLDRCQFDIAKAEWQKLSVAGFDYVINAAGLINRRVEERESFYIINAIFPHVLSALCARHGCGLIHFSTDCVFDGVHAPFYEDSPAAAPDLYARSKALGEPAQALVIRTSIIGPEQKHYYNLLCWSLAQTHIKGFTNHLWNGITTFELARLIEKIISGSLYVEGVRHLFSEDSSKYELIRSICAVFSHDAHIAETLAPETRDTRLRTRFPDFIQALGIRPRQQQLMELLNLAGSNGRWLKQEQCAS